MKKSDSVIIAEYADDLALINGRSELILGLHPANDRRRYKVKPSLIGWAQT